MVKINSPYVFIGVLVLAILASSIMCAQYYDAADISSGQISFKNGSTVKAGDKIIDVPTMQKVPVIAQPQNIIRPITTLDVQSLFTIFTTGMAPKDVIKNDTYITRDGSVSDQVSDLGVVVEDENGKISINKTDRMVWGYKLSKTYAVKDGESINLVENNTTTKSMKVSEINNDTVPTDFRSAATIKEWAESAADGSNLSVDYYLGNFSDNRSAVYSKEDIIKYFGEDAYKYMKEYTPGAPVLVYEHNASKTKVSEGVSVVESLAGYPTQIRAANAREFARGWNGTIIPPHSAAHGKEDVSFTAIAESEAASGSATHGVCPPGRSLRQAVLALGNPLPVGMSMGDEAILYEYRPTIDVSVTNNGDYPIKIIMWTEGEGGGTTIYTEIYELKDNNTYVIDSSNTTVSDSSE